MAYRITGDDRPRPANKPDAGTRNEARRWANEARYLEEKARQQARKGGRRGH